uniref:CN hydrolase domain-containing protein n=1 Tax=Megaselia scalaris TaxID=36166 RepID=T1GAT7_MEGSC
TLNRFGPDVLVPSAKDNYSPCGNSTYDFLSDLSCKARELGTYLVVNLYEKERCTVATQNAKNDPRNCSPTGWSKFNTNVVFDRKGVVIARYRKTHLYGEPGVNVTYSPEHVTFDTDFGVKFGTFICFDMLFESPAQDLVKKYNVTDFVYPTYWFSELPFLTASSVSQKHAFPGLELKG